MLAKGMEWMKIRKMSQNHNLTFINKVRLREVLIIWINKKQMKGSTNPRKSFSLKKKTTQLRKLKKWLKIHTKIINNLRTRNKCTAKDNTDNKIHLSILATPVTKQLLVVWTSNNKTWWIDKICQVATLAFTEHTREEMVLQSLRRRVSSNQSKSSRTSITITTFSTIPRLKSRILKCRVATWSKPSNIMLPPRCQASNKLIRIKMESLL